VLCRWHAVDDDYDDDVEIIPSSASCTTTHDDAFDRSYPTKDAHRDLTAIVALSIDAAKKKMPSSQKIRLLQDIIRSTTSIIGFIIIIIIIIII
jgi:hypothetical protein